MTALNYVSLFSSGIATGFMLVYVYERDVKWSAIFSALAVFFLLMAFK